MNANLPDGCKADQIPGDTPRDHFLRDWIETYSNDLQMFRRFLIEWQNFPGELITNLVMDKTAMKQWLVASNDLANDWEVRLQNGAEKAYDEEMLDAVPAW